MEAQEKRKGYVNDVRMNDEYDQVLLYRHDDRIHRAEEIRIQMNYLDKRYFYQAVKLSLNDLPISWRKSVTQRRNFNAILMERFSLHATGT
jgi:YesN/AraC family two-component response regulator